MASAYDTQQRERASDVSAIADFENTMSLSQTGPGSQQGGEPAGATFVNEVSRISSNASTTNDLQMQHIPTGNDETAPNIIDEILNIDGSFRSGRSRLSEPTLDDFDPLSRSSLDVFGRDVSRVSFASAALHNAPPPLPPGGVAWYRTSDGTRFLVIDIPLSNRDPDWDRLRDAPRAELQFLGAEPSLSPEMLPDVYPGITAANMTVWTMDQNLRDILHAGWTRRQAEQATAARAEYIARLRSRYATQPQQHHHHLQQRERQQREQQHRQQQQQQQQQQQPWHQSLGSGGGGVADPSTPISFDLLSSHNSIVDDASAISLWTDSNADYPSSRAFASAGAMSASSTVEPPFAISTSQARVFPTHGSIPYSEVPKMDMSTNDPKFAEAITHLDRVPDLAAYRPPGGSRAGDLRYVTEDVPGAKDASQAVYLLIQSRAPAHSEIGCVMSNFEKRDLGPSEIAHDGLKLIGFLKSLLIDASNSGLLANLKALVNERLDPKANSSKFIARKLELARLSNLAGVPVDKRFVNFLVVELLDLRFDVFRKSLEEDPSKAQKVYNMDPHALNTLVIRKAKEAGVASNRLVSASSVASTPVPQSSRDMTALVQRLIIERPRDFETACWRSGFVKNKGQATYYVESLAKDPSYAPKGKTKTKFGDRTRRGNQNPGNDGGGGGDEGVSASAVTSPPPPPPPPPSHPSPTAAAAVQTPATENALDLGDSAILASAAAVLTEVGSLSDDDVLELEEDWTDSTGSSPNSNAGPGPYALSFFDPLSLPNSGGGGVNSSLDALFESVDFSRGGLPDPQPFQTRVGEERPHEDIDASITSADVDSYLHEIDVTRAPLDFGGPDSSAEPEVEDWTGPYASHIDPAFWTSTWSQASFRGDRAPSLTVPVLTCLPTPSANCFAALADEEDDGGDEYDVGQIRASSAAVSLSAPAPLVSSASSVSVHPQYTSKPRRKTKRPLEDRSLQSRLWYSRKDLAAFSLDPINQLDYDATPEFSWLKESRSADRRDCRRTQIRRATDRDHGPLVIPPCVSPRRSPRVRVGSVERRVFWYFEEPVWVGTDCRTDAPARSATSAGGIGANLTGILRRREGATRSPSSVESGGSLIEPDDTAAVPAPEIPSRSTKQRLPKPRQRQIPAQSHALRDMSSRELVDHLFGIPSESAESDDLSSNVVVHVKASSARKLEHCPKERAVADSGATHHLWNRFQDFRTFRRLVGQSVLLPDGTRMAILGIGSIVISMGGKRVLLRNVYLVEGLRVPLFSLRVHRRCPGCGHEANNDGFFVFFPDFELTVDDAVDSYLEYQSAEKSEDETFDYVEPTASELDALKVAASHASAGSRRSERLRQREQQRIASEQHQETRRLRNRRHKLNRRQRAKPSSPGDPTTSAPPAPSPQPAGTSTWVDVVSGNHDSEFDTQDDDCEVLEPTASLMPGESPTDAAIRLLNVQPDLVVPASENGGPGELISSRPASAGDQASDANESGKVERLDTRSTTPPVQDGGSPTPQVGGSAMEASSASEEAPLDNGSAPPTAPSTDVSSRVHEPSPFEVLLTEGFASLLGKNDGRLNTKFSDLSPADLARRLSQNVGGEDALLNLLDTLNVENPKIFDSRTDVEHSSAAPANPAALDDGGTSTADSVNGHAVATIEDEEEDDEDEDEPMVSSTSPSGPKRISFEELQFFHEDPAGLAPAVRPCDTPNGSDTVQHLTSDRIVRAYGGRRFRNFENVARVLKGAKFVNSGAPLETLSRFTSMRRSKRGQVQPPSKKYLDKVHVDILFGDVVANLGYRYALLLVDRATKYIWIYGLKSLLSENIIDAFSQFRADAGGLPRQFRCDCDQKLMGGDARRWIYRNNSKIIGAPAGRQSSNGLAERAWQTIRDRLVAISSTRECLVDTGSLLASTPLA